MLVPILAPGPLTVSVVDVGTAVIVSTVGVGVVLIVIVPPTIALVKAVPFPACAVIVFADCVTFPVEYDPIVKLLPWMSPLDDTEKLLSVLLNDPPWILPVTLMSPLSDPFVGLSLTYPLELELLVA